jgi:hypothetical protein
MNYGQNKGYSMKNLSATTHSTRLRPDKGQKTTTEGSHSSKGDVIVKSVITAVAVSTIMQTGKGVIAALAKHPLALFSLGIATGYFTHKYRKEIISVTNLTAEQSKDFVSRQKEHLKNLLVETQEDAEKKDI